MARILFDSNGRVVGVEREYPPPRLRDVLRLIFICPIKYRIKKLRGIMGMTEVQDAYLITYTDEGDASFFVFTDPAWAAWLDSAEPAWNREGGYSTNVRWNELPAGIREAHAEGNLDDDDGTREIACNLTSGTYHLDKITFLMDACGDGIHPNDFKAYNFVGTYATEAY